MENENQHTNNSEQQQFCPDVRHRNRFTDEEVNASIVKLEAIIAEGITKEWTKDELRDIVPMYKGKPSRFDPKYMRDLLITKRQPKAPRATVSRPMVSEPLWMNSIMGPPPTFFSFRGPIPTQDEVAEKIKTIEDSKQPFIELAIDVVEIAAANPQMGEILPQDNEPPAEEPENQCFSIDVWTQRGYIGNIHHPRETASSISNPCFVSQDEVGLDSFQTIKAKVASDFKIENAPPFPLNYEQFPNIIDEIEGYLSCFEKLNFRLAFSNMKTEPYCRIKETRESSSEVKEERIAPRACVCETRIFKNTKVLQREGKMGRFIFNHCFSLASQTPYAVRVTLQSVKETNHTYQCRYEMTNSRYASQRLDKHGWSYDASSIKVQIGKKVMNGDMDAIQSKRTGVLLHPHSQEWVKQPWFY